MRWRLLLVPTLLLAAGVLAVGEDAGFDPRFERGLPEDVLAEGAPALRRGDVDAVRAMIEAAFEMAVPLEDAWALAQTAEQAWPEMDAAERRAFLALGAPVGELRRHAREDARLEVERGLAAFRRSLDAYLAQRRGRPLATALEEALRLRRREAWAGDPPIHAAAADAYLALTALLVSLGRNEDVSPTEGQKSVVFEDLGRELAAREPAARLRVRDVHAPWLKLVATWLEGNATRRLALRFAALRLVADALPEDRRITLGEGRDMVAYARAATLLRAAQPGYEAWSVLARRPAKVLDAVEAWLAAAPATAPRPRPLLD